VLTRSGGKNFYGEPRRRLVWGASRLGLCWNPRLGAFEQRPQYATRPHRWYVEQYRPAEDYGTPEKWFAQNEYREFGRSVEVVGPFPRRGDYEWVFTFETPHKKWCSGVSRTDDGGCPTCGGCRFTPVNAQLLREFVQVLDTSRHVSARERYDRYSGMRDTHHREWDSMADDMIKDLQPTWGVTPTIYTPAKWFGEK
jgi:hypothetical protein